MNIISLRKRLLAAVKLLSYTKSYLYISKRKRGEGEGEGGNFDRMVRDRLCCIIIFSMKIQSYKLEKH